jgi:hypothetical protein
MPVVRRYGGPKVGREMAPGVRLGADAPTAAFQPVQGIDVGKVAGVAAEIVQHEQQRADEIAFTDADARASQLETSILHGEGGVLSTQGSNAFEAPEKASETWMKGVSEIESGLKSPRAKEAFRKSAQKRWDSIYGQTQVHVARERRQYDTEATKALLTVEQDAAVRNWNDPERVELAIERQVSAAKEFARRNGMPPEALEALVSERVSSTRTDVINEMLANGQDLAAEAYFKQHKDQIGGKDLPRVERDLEEGSLRGKSQRESDRIFAANQGSQGDALAEARKIEDPKLRDDVESRLNHRFVLQRQIDRESENDAYVAAANFIDARPNLSARDAVPPNVWNSLKPTQRRSLEIYAKGGGTGGSEGSGSQGGEKAWLDFLELNTDEVEDLTRSEFETKYLSKLSGRERGRAITRWKDARAGTGSAKEEKRVFTLKEDIENSLRSANLIGTNEKTSSISNAEKRVLARVESQVQAQRDEFRARTGKAPSPSDDRMIVDAVVMKHFFEEGGEKLNLRAGGQSVTLEKSRRGVRVDYAQIPSARRSVLEAESRRLGGKASRDQIERAYAASLMEDEAAVQKALKER